MKLLDGLSNPRVLGILLALSLALNLFAGGVVAGRFSADRMHPPPPLFAPGADSLFRAVPEAQRKLIRDKLRETRPALRDEHRTMRRLHREIREELGKASPDRALLEQKLAAARARLDEMEQAMHAAFLDTVLAMPSAERREMLEAIGRDVGRRGPGHPGMHDAPPPPGAFPPGPPPEAPLPPP